MTNPTHQGVTLREALAELLNRRESDSYSCGLLVQDIRAEIERFEASHPPASEQASVELCIGCQQPAYCRKNGCDTPTAEPVGVPAQQHQDVPSTLPGLDVVKPLLSASPAAPEQGDTHHCPQQGDTTWPVAPEAAKQKSALTPGHPMTFGGCPFCCRQDCVAGQCQRAAKPETTERDELIDWLNQSADQCAVFPSTAHEAKRYRQAAALLASDDSSPNAPWITEAHMLCTDHGIEPGHITERIKALREKLAADGKAGGEVVELSAEWTPCVKLPITVHVRKQRPGEVHVSTREGITPVKPDDLIMRGVQGEEYPIGRELWEKTYTTGTRPQQAAQCIHDAEWIGRRTNAAYEAGKQAAQVAQPLTYDQLSDICPGTIKCAWSDAVSIARAVEHAHGIGRKEE